MARRELNIDLKSPRPTTRREVRELILETYRDNRWDSSDQVRHQAMLGLEEKLLSDRTNEEYQTIIDDFERSRMVVFR